MKNLVSGLRLPVRAMILTTLLAASLSAGTAARAQGPTDQTAAEANSVAAACTPTGFMKDGINLTAALINPAGTVTATINATGCNIGVYYSTGITGTINGAHVFGANYYGVLNDGGHVNISNAYIHNIGEAPLNGVQHGVAIDFTSAGATGQIVSTVIWNYQKLGIGMTSGAGPATVIAYNTIIGLGPVDFIAQDGIEVGNGSTATVYRNTITGNSYTGAGQASSGGVLVYGGSCYGAPVSANNKIANNVLLGNDVGVYLSNLETNPLDPTGCSATAALTRNLAYANIIEYDAVNNTTGNGTGPYQAGISDQGNYDIIVNNSICGAGYTTPPNTYTIDTTQTNNPYLVGNTSCSGASLSASPQATHGSTRAIASIYR